MRKYAGDTLIEVLIAFAILSTITGVAFGGALSSFRSAVSAQWRTEATFVAQYEADALLTYRKSLSWDDFIDKINTGKNSYPNGFCLQTNSSNSTINYTYWEISNCDNINSKLLTNVTSPSVKIVIDQQESVAGSGDFDRALATITVDWIGKNGQTETVRNLVLLTKEQ